MHVCPMDEEPENPEERGSSSVENSNVRNEPGEAIAVERVNEQCEHASNPWVSTAEQPGARARRRPKIRLPKKSLIMRLHMSLTESGALLAWQAEVELRVIAP